MNNITLFNQLPPLVQVAVNTIQRNYEAMAELESEKHEIKISMEIIKINSIEANRKRVLRARINNKMRDLNYINQLLNVYVNSRVN